MRGAYPYRATVAGVGAFSALPDDDEVDPRVARQRAAHPLVEPTRPQIDVVVQFEADLEQQPALQQSAGHRRITDRTEQDQAVAAQLVDHAGGQNFSVAWQAPRTQVGFGALHSGQHHVEYLECLADDFRADAVTGDDRQLHWCRTVHLLPPPHRFHCIVAGTSRQVHRFHHRGLDGVADRVRAAAGTSRIQSQHHRRPAAGGVLAQLGGLNVHPGLAEQGADLAQRAWLVSVMQIRLTPSARRSKLRPLIATIFCTCQARTACPRR